MSLQALNQFPCQIPDGPSGTLTSWETHHPRPVIPASVGNLKEPGQDVYRLWLKYLLFSQVPPLAPWPPPLSSAVLLKAPQTSQAFSFPPTGLPASSLSPQTLHSPLWSWGDSFDIHCFLGSPSFLLLRSYTVP